MKLKAGMVVAVILAAAGLTTAANFSTQLYGQTVLFDQSSVQIDGHSYVGYEIAVNLNGKYQPSITGGVGSVGCCVDFYLVNDTSWNPWSMNPAMRDALSIEHLNSTVVSSQSIQGQFSFVPSGGAGYSVVFANDEYPNASNATVHATITLQYTSLGSVYALVVGVALLGVGLGVLTMALRGRAKPQVAN
jgi:hypothetical protein